MQHYDQTIIGTGSGNSIPDPNVDPRYADMRIAICEQGVFGGTCLNVGCIPTKMFVYAAEVAHTVRHSAQYGVDAHIDKIRWPDIVARVFGRIDPIASGGEARLSSTTRPSSRARASRVLASRARARLSASSSARPAMGLSTLKGEEESLAMRGIVRRGEWRDATPRPRKSPPCGGLGRGASRTG